MLITRSKWLLAVALVARVKCPAYFEGEEEEEEERKKEKKGAAHS